jgi:hypothetical protein
LTAIILSLVSCQCFGVISELYRWQWIAQPVNHRKPERRR